MSLLQLALAYVWHRRLVSALSVLCIALGAALILVVLNIRRQVEATFLTQTQHYDLVVGATGSESALVLTALFHAEVPRGNIPVATYHQLRTQAGVLAAFPLSFGDTYQGLRIVGTSREFLEQPAATGGALFELADGRLFEKEFELVVGAEAAARHELKLGSRVVGAHGIAADAQEHREHPYVVVGILKPTGTAQDRGLFTTLESYWEIHGQAREKAERGPGKEAWGVDDPTQPEVTAVLLRCVKPLVFQLAQLLPRKYQVMAVRPGEVMQRMFLQVLEPVERMLLVYGSAVVAVAALSILSTLYLTTVIRRRDLAILRALGATPWEVFAVVLLEAGVLLVIGNAAGVLLSQAIGSALRGDFGNRFGLQLAIGQFTQAELVALLTVFLTGLLAAFLPAWQAYRSDVASGLRQAR